MTNLLTAEANLRRRVADHKPCEMLVIIDREYSAFPGLEHAGVTLSRDKILQDV
jgi:hypothetical protein